MKKIVSILAIIAIFGVSLFVLTGCGANNGTNNNVQTLTQDENFINNNNSYYFIIDGEKYTAGDKISELDKVGLATRDSEKDQNVPANKYMIGAGYMVNSNKKTVIQVTPYNTQSVEAKVSNSCIGGVVIDANNAKNDERLSNVEIYGGIKLGSSEEDVKRVFGEPTSKYEGTTYNSYTYKSDEVYRSFEIRIDKEGKVSYMKWQNLVFNK